MTFDQWAAAVDTAICAECETARNEITAPYAEMYLAGYSIQQAVQSALDLDACNSCGAEHQAERATRSW